MIFLTWFYLRHFLIIITAMIPWFPPIIWRNFEVIRTVHGACKYLYFRRQNWVSKECDIGVFYQHYSLILTIFEIVLAEQSGKRQNNVTYVLLPLCKITPSCGGSTLSLSYLCTILQKVFFLTKFRVSNPNNVLFWSDRMK